MPGYTEFIETPRGHVAAVRASCSFDLTAASWFSDVTLCAFAIDTPYSGNREMHVNTHARMRCCVPLIVTQMWRIEFIAEDLTQRNKKYR